MTKPTWLLAANDETVTTDHKRSLSYLVESTLMECHRILDGLNIPRGGGMYPLDGSLLRRLNHLQHGYHVTRFAHLEDEHDE